MNADGNTNTDNDAGTITTEQTLEKIKAYLATCDGDAKKRKPESYYWSLGSSSYDDYYDKMNDAADMRAMFADCEHVDDETKVLTRVTGEQSRCDLSDAELEQRCHNALALGRSLLPHQKELGFQVMLHVISYWRKGLDSHVYVFEEEGEEVLEEADVAAFVLYVEACQWPASSSAS